jgi:SAM-dependent methyltransferase
MTTLQRFIYKAHPLRLQFKIKKILQYKLGIKFFPESETEKVRPLVINFCKGKGCDLGFGGDKICKTDCDGIDYPQPYTKVGKDNVDVGCDIIKDEIPLPENTYDYVYSSHLIEDFEDTQAGIIKMMRILKNNGVLILAFPDQQKYEWHCNRYGTYPNPYHKHQDMGYAYMVNCLNSIDAINYTIVFESNCKIDYNVILVLKIHKL